MELIIPLIIDQTTHIPEQLDPSFILNGPLLKTKKESLLVACRQDDCSYVAKKLGLSWFTPSDCYTPKDVARNEILISKMAANLGVGPKIHAAALNDEEGIMIMDRYDGTLEDLISLYQKDQSIPIESVVATVGKALQILHQNGIVHRDFHPGNIFYTREGTVAVADYELSLLSDSEPLRQRDRDIYMVIVNTVKRIKEGRRFATVRKALGDVLDEMKREGTIPPKTRVSRLLWNGNLCPDLSK